MNAFSHSLGRLQSMRRRESKKKHVQPIDVDAAKQYHHAGPCSAASSSLLTPRPHHYRSSSSSSNSTTPSPATPGASTFASAPSSARIVSSPTFVSSSALAPANAFHAEFDALTPPLSPVHPNSAAAAQATKSPLRRALSRTFFFASSHSNASANPQPTTPRISSPIPTATETTTIRAPRPARPARPATSPASEFSPQLNAFGFAAPPTMSRSQTSAPIVITPPVDITTRRRSRTLMPSALLVDSATDKPAASQRSVASSWSMRFSRTPSPISIASSGASAPDALSSINSPPTSLRSIRQRHARKSISSIFGSPPSAAASATPESTSPSAKSSSTDSSHLLSLRRRLVRRASEESFHCRGPGFDAPPAADTRPSMEHDSSYRPILRSCPPTAMARSVSLNSCTYPAITSSSGARRMSDFTISSYKEQANATIGAQRHVQDILSETETEDESEKALAGLGLVSPLPATPRFLPKRLSVTSRISLTDSIPSSVPSSSSTLSLSWVENQLNSSWADIPSMQNWFSTCPPTPPSSIRLQLGFRSLPPPSPALLGSTATELEGKKPRPLSGIFISSNSSVLDLKETIVTQMREQGYRLSPRNLTLMLHLNDDVRSHSQTALGLKLSAYGKNPAKVLDDSSRLLFEEGAQEEDMVVVDCDPSHVLWSI